MGIQERREREKEELRRKIIHAASRLISSVGHENLTIRRLAREIEYSPRTIYLYFRDKEHLLQEVVEEGFRRTLEIRRQEEPDPSASPEAILRRRLRTHIDSALSDGNFYRAVVTLLFEKNFEPGPAQREIMARTREEIAALLPPQARDESKTAAYAMIIFSTIRGFTLSLLDLAEKMSAQQVEDLIEHYIAFVQRGVHGGIR